ncbi:MAG: hypothetical protein ACR2NP_01150 [Pirellulaceae bacterium]
MKTVSPILVAFLFGVVLPAESSFAQDEKLPSADTVLQDYIDALGGEMLISSLESIQINGKFSGPSSGEMKFYYDKGKARVNFYVGDDQSQQIAYWFDGEVVWHRNGNVVELLEGAAADNSLESTVSPTIALYWAEYPGTVRVVDRVNIDDVEAIHLQFTSEHGTVFDRYFGVESRLLIKSVFHDTQQERTITNSYEYQTVDGIKFISKKKQHHVPGDFIFDYTYDDVDINSDVDASNFERPDDLEDQLERRN